MAAAATGQKILRYPIKFPVPSLAGGDDVEAPTEGIDYLCMQRYAIAYNDKTAAYYGQNLPGNNVKKNLNQKRVYLAVPNNISTTYTPTYNQVDLGVAGVAAAGLLSTSQGVSAMASVLQSAAGAALPEFAASAISSTANSLGQMLGLEGNINASTLAALTRGKVFNPFTEQIFKNMSFRTHNFNFRFFVRSPTEAQEVYYILQYIKEGAVPSISGGEKPTAANSNNIQGALQNSVSFGGANANRFFNVPDKFQLSYKRFNYEPSSTSGGGIELHHKIKDSVCAGIQVNYTPDGSYTAFKELLTANANVRGGNKQNNPYAAVHVPSLTLQLTFIETSIVSAADILAGY